MKSCHIYVTKALAKQESNIKNSIDWHNYFYSDHPTKEIEDRLFCEINNILSLNIGSRKARNIIYEHLFTSLDCFNQYNLVHGYSLDGVFYPTRSGHDRSQEIHERRLPLETRSKWKYKLHSIFKDGQIIDCAEAIQNHGCFLVPGALFFSA
jgi:hypothetical protein